MIVVHLLIRLCSHMSLVNFQGETMLYARPFHGPIEPSREWKGNLSIPLATNWESRSNYVKYLNNQLIIL